jgi:hypothetical protein
LIEVAPADATEARCIAGFGPDDRDRRVPLGSDLLGLVWGWTEGEGPDKGNYLGQKQAAEPVDGRAE